MADLILTGASRGIGRALALALATRGHRLLLVARDRAKLDEVVSSVSARGGNAIAIPGDLSSQAEARRLGMRLAAVAAPGATLVHNAGIWPHRKELNADGQEMAFAVNCVGPLQMQRQLIDAGCVARILVVSAGLVVQGRFDAARTPSGEDFSSLRTYCSTKLAFAVAMRDVAAAHPDIDVLVLHPGVVATDLGARPGLVGWLLGKVKRAWESPEVCAERLARILARERWSPRGEARWQIEERVERWPAVADDERTRRAVRDVVGTLLGAEPRQPVRLAAAE